MFFLLLLQLFVIISGIGKKSKKEKNSFTLNFRTTEIIDDVKIVKKGEEKIESVDNITVKELLYNVEKKDGLDVFKYKIKIKAKKEDFLTNNHDIYIYIDKKEIQCIVSDFKFDEKNYKIIHLKLYAPKNKGSEEKGMLIYDPDEKSIERDVDGTFIFEMNDYDPERLLKKRINNLKEIINFYIDSIINLDREYINLERKHGDLNKYLSRLESELKENFKLSKNAVNATENDRIAFELIQNELFDRKRDYLSFKIRNGLAIEEKRKKKEAVRSAMCNSLLKHFDLIFKPSISPDNDTVVPPSTSDNEEKEEGCSEIKSENDLSGAKKLNIENGN